MVMRGEDSQPEPAEDITPASTTAAGQEPADDREVVKRYEGTGVSALLLGMFLVFVLFIVVLAQNTDSVRFDFLWVEFEPPLFVLLLATMAAAAGLTLIVAEIWRRRRRRTRTEREELARLRRQREAAS